jgi:hypothetical protein
MILYLLILNFLLESKLLLEFENNVLFSRSGIFIFIFLFF